MANYDSGSLNKDYDCYSSVSLRLEKSIAFGERIIFPETDSKLCAGDAERDGVCDVKWDWRGR